jgi:Radial spokehead-like protein
MEGVLPLNLFLFFEKDAISFGRVSKGHCKNQLPFFHEKSFFVFFNFRMFLFSAIEGYPPWSVHLGSKTFPNQSFIVARSNLWPGAHTIVHDQGR